jgi:hypothetical protein
VLHVINLNGDITDITSALYPSARSNLSAPPSEILRAFADRTHCSVLVKVPVNSSRNLTAKGHTRFLRPFRRARDVGPLRDDAPHFQM